MQYFKKQSLHERLVGDKSFILTSDGDIEINAAGGDIRITGDVSVDGNISGPEVENVLYVSKDGDDDNDGRSAGPDGAKATIKSAVATANSGDTIIVAPGDYYEENPITLPDFVTITGQGELRNTRIFPKNDTRTIFYMGNGCYLYQLTFRALRAPGWCVEIAPNTLCTTSPYVQNCTNMNGPWLNDGTEFVPFETVQIEGIEPGARPLLAADYPELSNAKTVNDEGGGGGMLVDGDQYNPASLVKSFVADAFTQIAQGGKGFEITNFGYTQIVSCFTVFCSTGFAATNGGYLSISNSVSDFGTKGVVADGFYPTSYTSARPEQDYSSSVASVTVNNPGSGYTSAPVVTIEAPDKPGGVTATGTAQVDLTTGQLAAVSINLNGSGYDQVPQITFSGGGATIQAQATVNLQTNSTIRLNSLRDIPQVGSILQFQGDATYYYITENTQINPPFFYDEEVCRRDLRRIVDAVTSDIVFGTNYQSLAAGTSYLRATSKKVLTDQLAPTIFGINSARDEMKQLAANQSTKDLIDDRFSIITNIISAGDSASTPDLVYNDLSSIDLDIRRAKDNVVENRDFIIEEITAYIQKQFTDLSYDKNEFDTTTTKLIKGIAYNVALGSNFHVVRTAENFEYRDSFKDFYQGIYRYLENEYVNLTEVQASSLAISRTRESFRTFDTIVFDGDSSGLDVVIPDHTGAEENRQDSRDQLLANKPFLSGEFIAWLEENEEALTFDWDSSITQGYIDDFEKIIDALAFDIMYTGNSGIVTETEYFYDKNKIGNFTSANAAALGRGFAHMRQVIARVVRGVVHNPTTGNTETQDFSSNNATLNEANQLDVLLFNTEDVVTEQDKNRLPLISYPVYPDEAQAIQDAATAILDEITDSLADAYTWARSNYPNQTYDIDKCKRDVGYIIDATYRDAQLGTNHNSITAGLAYQRANTSYLNGEQKPATLIALKEAKRLSVAQSAGNSAFQTAVGERWDDVITIAEYNQLPSEGTVYPDPGPASQALINAKTQLINNKDFLIEDVIAYVDNNYFVYDDAKCERDTGIILDGIKYDVALNTNYNSVTNGLAYQRANSAYVLSDQNTETVAAIQHAKGQANTALGVSSIAQTRSDAGFDEVVDIIQNGVVSTETAADPKTFPVPSTQAASVTNARDRLQNNRDFLAADVSAYITNNFPSLSFNAAKCERDAKFLVDALTYDVVYGGNSATYDAASAYWVGATTQVAGQQAETAAGFAHLKNIVDEVLLGITVTAQTGNAESQDVSGSNASSTEVDTVVGLVDFVENVIQYGTDNLPTTKTYPDIDNLGLPTAIVTAAKDLDTQRSSIITSTINFINTTYDGFSYDLAKCRRDTGYLLDAVVHDLLYTGNIATLIATRAYFLGTQQYIPADQKDVTVEAFGHLASIIDDIIIGNAITKQTGNAESQSLTGDFGGASEGGTAVSLVNILKDAVDAESLTGTPGEVQPAFNWLTASVRNAAAAYLAQKENIKDDVIDYIFKNITDFEYNIAKCESDTGKIIDAVMYDLMYGGNKQHRRAAEAYYSGTILSAAKVGNADQILVSAYTYKHLADVMNKVAQNDLVERSDGLTNTAAIAAGKAAQIRTIPDATSTTAGTISLYVNRIAQSVEEKTITGWYEIEHDHSLGNAIYLNERNTILAEEDEIVDAAIADLNLEYGGRYDVRLFPGVVAVDEGTLGLLYNVSTISTSGHAFEYVGAGVTYNALPFFGGSPVQEQEIIQTNQGKVFAGGTVDQIGNFRVGDFFSVNALTGAITLNANEIDLSGLTSVGPFIRDGIPVGVELKEVSDSANLTASIGTQDFNTVPTQRAVATYVENRYLNKLNGGTVEADVTFETDIQVDGGDITTTATTFNLLNANATTVNAFGDADTISIGAATGTLTINPDLVVQGDITVNGFVNFVGDVSITIPDQTLQAYSITEGTEDYVSINTREGEEKVSFGDQPKVEILNNSASTDKTTGALVVSGGVGIAENLYVGGLFQADGNIALGSDRTQDTVVIQGNTDVDVNDNSAEAFVIHENISDYFTVDTTDTAEKVSIGSVPVLEVLNNTNATSGTTGAVQVTGGIGAELDIYSGQNITADQDIIAERDVYVNGTQIITDETGSFAVFNTNAQTINAFGDATTVNIGAATGTMTLNNEITIFDSVEAIQVPVGTNAERPTEVTGQIRFNTDRNAFEGYDGTAWNSLSGVIDADQDTYIIPELTSGSDNDTLYFYTGGSERATINNTTVSYDSSVNVVINSTTGSTTYADGALTVAGGAGIAENLYVQGFVSGNNSGVLQLTNLATDQIDIRANTILSQDGVKILTNAPDSAADDIVYPMTFAHHTISGTPVAGSGTGIKFELETASSNFETGGQIDVIARDVTGGQEDFDISFKSMTAGSLTEKLLLSETSATVTTDLIVNGVLDAAGFTGSIFADDSTEIIDAIGNRLTVVNADIGTLTLTTDLEVQYGGTGASTFTENGILYGDTTNPVQVTDAAGTSDATESFQVLTVTSASDATPVWTDTIDGGSF